jgi:translation initiation factor 2B subunit (eIF-2B alpha/beta/delta family)
MTLPRARPRARAGLEAVGRDARSGASQLAARAVAALARETPRDALAPARAHVERIVALARAAASLRPGMPAVGGAVARVAWRLRVEARGARDAGEVHRRLRAIVRAERESLARARQATARAFTRRFRGVSRPLTLSYSTTLLAALGGRGRFDEIVVCESRPLCEGRRLARALRRAVGAGVVTLVTEAQAVAALASCDAVVIGCDAIFGDGSVANKSGSAPLAAAARVVGRRVIVLGDAYKLADRSTFAPEARGAREVWAGAPAGVRVRNETFEVVSRDWIDFIVLDDGVWRPRDMAAKWRDARRYRRALRRPA